MTEQTLIRLNKFISDTGYCSRREADKLVDQGRVTINGEVAEMGTKVAAGDEVCVDDRPLRQKEAPIYIALNKPPGITCTTERHIEDNIVDFIGHRKRIFPIGRLDKASDGLIFLTNDGDIVNKILRAGNNHEKEYVVRVDKPITDEFIAKMAAGVAILDTVTLPCKVVQESRFVFRITLTQGLNRQIRRMCEALGYDVFKLKRVRIMNVTIDGLPTGKWRYLTDAEMAQINAMIADSSKTEEASAVAPSASKPARTPAGERNNDRPTRSGGARVKTHSAKGYDGRRARQGKEEGSQPGRKKPHAGRRDQDQRGGARSQGNTGRHRSSDNTAPAKPKSDGIIKWQPKR
uniref:23S rRNA pseudouridine(2604) synthase RluF n=1 Tax=Thaumasiovibrio occultus TaxID=1891184 RepID=UPI000B34EF0E|nr:23S rRNA pseudouridine(2604) synthase RluF [Thaumasiovibrio occultus]